MTKEKLKKAQEISEDLLKLKQLKELPKYFEFVAVLGYHLFEPGLKDVQINLPTWLKEDCFETLTPLIDAKILELESDFENL